jgi:hypothetical protein
MGAPFRRAAVVSETRQERVDRLTSDGGWIGVDLDGTLAEYHGWKGQDDIGQPIAEMVCRVEAWLAAGVDVRIFTARASGDHGPIQRWCAWNIGSVLPITNVKDMKMIELWDDRAVQIVTNTGRRADGLL